MKGKIKFFNNAKGFGFIIPDDGERDIFFHRNDSADGVVFADGDSVTFEIEKSPKGPKAVNVVVGGVV